MTKEEYMAHTNIKSPGEAREYLTHLHRLFIIVFVVPIVVKFFPIVGDFFLSLLVLGLQLILWGYFIWYNLKVKRAIGIIKESVGWCIIFAPLSWFWYYPIIMDPLRIIVGEKEPPASISLPRTAEEQAIANKSVNRNVWRTIGMCFLVAIGVIALMVLGEAF